MHLVKEKSTLHMRDNCNGYGNCFASVVSFNSDLLLTGSKLTLVRTLQRSDVRTIRSVRHFFYCRIRKDLRKTSDEHRVYESEDERSLAKATVCFKNRRKRIRSLKVYYRNLVDRASLSTTADMQPYENKVHENSQSVSIHSTFLPTFIMLLLE